MFCFNDFDLCGFADGIRIRVSVAQRYHGVYCVQLVSTQYETQCEDHSRKVSYNSVRFLYTCWFYIINWMRHAKEFVQSVLMPRKSFMRFYVVLCLYCKVLVGLVSTGCYGCFDILLLSFVSSRPIVFCFHHFQPVCKLGTYLCNRMGLNIFFTTDGGVILFLLIYPNIA